MRNQHLYFRHLRERLTLSQDELALLLGAGSRTLQAWERGTKKMPPYALEGLFKLTNDYRIGQTKLEQWLDEINKNILIYVIPTYMNERTYATMPWLDPKPFPMAKLYRLAAITIFHRHVKQAVLMDASELVHYKNENERFNHLLGEALSVRKLR